MRCAVCGGALEPVENDVVESFLKPSEIAAKTLGSLKFRGWRCPHCAPEELHLRGYESTSASFAHCPSCHELTMVSEAPYVIPNIATLAPDLRITNHHCVNCDYTYQRKELVHSWIDIDIDDNNGGGGSDVGSGTGFSGGSSGGGGAGGGW